MANKNTVLRSRRKELGLTMKDVAKRVGVSEATVSRWENGIIDNMRRDRIAKLADVLKVDPIFIIDSYEMSIDPRQSLKDLVDTLSDEEYARLVEILRLVLPEKFQDLE